MAETTENGTTEAAPATLLGGAATETTATETTALPMPEGFEGGADGWAKLDDAGKTGAITAATEKATAESKGRTDAFAAAQGKDARLAAYNALTEAEKAAAFKALKPDQVKELGIEDPTLPVYDLTKFKLPDGATLDEKTMSDFATLTRGMKLSQDDAQKLLDMSMARQQAIAEDGRKAWNDLQTKWTSEARADPEIGGARMTASLAAASRAIDRLGVPGLREALNLTGAGNHPAVVKAFVRLGQMVSEDRFMPGKDAAPPAPRSPAETIYDGGPKRSADAV